MMLDVFLMAFGEKTIESPSSSSSFQRSATELLEYSPLTEPEVGFAQRALLRAHDVRRREAEGERGREERDCLASLSVARSA